MKTFDDTEAEFCRLIGAFLLEFSQLETTIRMRLASAINLPERYSDIIMSAFDFARLCTVTEAILTQQHPQDSSEIKKLFGDCQSLNQERVRAAHGLLAPDMDGNFSARMVSRNNFKEGWHFGNGELVGLIDKAQGLMKRMIGLAS